MEWRGRWWHSTELLILFCVALIATHSPVLHLPYFWDEAGYYVPAARDLLLTGSLIPRSTVSNAHPPLVMAYLAAAWKLVGFTPLVTRSAMLLAAAFALLGVFRLAQRVANTEVAIAAVVCTATFPVFFAQSSLAHLDLAAAGFTVWGLLAYVDDRPGAAAVWFSLAALAKETAILGPVALLAWRVIRDFLGKWIQHGQGSETADSLRVLAADSRLRTARNDNIAGFLRTPRTVIDRRMAYALLFPVVPLAIWYGYHWQRTGFIFGNPEFFRYNVEATLNPLRIVLALGLRLWQLLGYMGMYLLTLSTFAAMLLPPISDGDQQRKRIAVDVQLSLLAVIVAYVLVLAVIGGAVLARYLLPVIPLVIIICVSTLRRRIRYWPVVVGIVVAAFIVGWVVNPSYGFSMEDNLAYRDYIELHERAESFIQTHYAASRVLTAWPASDELNRPFLGYVARPMPVFRIDDFTIAQLTAAANLHSKFDVAFIFSTKYEPAHPWFRRSKKWEQWNTEFFGYHRDVPLEVAAQILGGQVVYSEYLRGQWVGIIEVQQVQEARVKRLDVKRAKPLSGRNAF
jgi:4-amino-4-deoxy-L-arabinose transferase-like glycosyltransferase